MANICSDLIRVHIIPELTNFAPFAAQKLVLHLDSDQQKDAEQTVQQAMSSVQV